MEGYEVYVKHIPSDLSDATLKEFFEEYGGRVANIKVYRSVILPILLMQKEGRSIYIIFFTRRSYKSCEGTQWI